MSTAASRARSMGATVLSTVWLEVLRARRPVRYAEITRALPELSHNQRGPALTLAHRLGYLEREGRPRAYSYRVTPRCTVPPGVPIVEILEATT